MGRPRKNKDGQVGRAGRKMIELEELEREAERWRRRKDVLARFAAGAALKALGRTIEADMALAKASKLGHAGPA